MALGSARSWPRSWRLISAAHLSGIMGWGLGIWVIWVWFLLLSILHGQLLMVIVNSGLRLWNPTLHIMAPPRPLCLHTPYERTVEKGSYAAVFPSSSSSPLVSCRIVWYTVRSVQYHYTIPTLSFVLYLYPSIGETHSSYHSSISHDLSFPNLSYHTMIDI